MQRKDRSWMHGTGTQAQERGSAARIAGIVPEDSICYLVKKDGFKWARRAQVCLKICRSCWQLASHKARDV